MAHILHIDTSGPVALVMLATDGLPVDQRMSETERDHACKLNTLVAEVLESTNMRLADLDAIAVCNGPGSYTGLRIGLACAKGYCYALEKPLILHNRLLLMLCELKQQNIYNAGTWMSILPARMGEYYIAANGKYQMPPRHINAEMLVNDVFDAGFIYIIGTPGEDLETLSAISVTPHNLLDVSVWASVTHDAFIKGEWEDLAYAEPEYLKSVYITGSRADR